MGKNSLKKGKDKASILKNIAIMQTRGKTKDQAILTALALAGIINSKADPTIRPGINLDRYK